MTDDCVCGAETRIGWGTCAHCWDWIWPGEQVYTDAQGRTPICAVCHARAPFLAARAALSTPPDTEETP